MNEIVTNFFTDRVASTVGAFDFQGAVALAREHHAVILAPLVLFLIVFSQFHNSYFRAVLMLGYALVYQLSEEPELWVWPYVAGVLCVSVVAGGRSRERTVSSKAEAYHHAYRRRVAAFYAEHAPEKLANLDTIMNKYRGNERRLWESLQRKYVTPSKQPPPPPFDLDSPVPDDPVPAATPVPASPITTTAIPKTPAATTTTPPKTPSATTTTPKAPSAKPASSVARAREEARREQEERLKRRLERRT